MDDRDNYHTSSTTFAAIRVPQVDGNLALKRAILAGTVAQSVDSSILDTRMRHLGVNLNSWEQIPLSIAFNEGGKREFFFNDKQ